MNFAARVDISNCLTSSITGAQLAEDEVVLLFEVTALLVSIGKKYLYTQLEWALFQNTLCLGNANYFSQSQFNKLCSEGSCKIRHFNFKAHPNMFVY